MFDYLIPLIVVVGLVLGLIEWWLDRSVKSGITLARSFILIHSPKNWKKKLEKEKVFISCN
jgi:hypothetical protein